MFIEASPCKMGQIGPKMHQIFIIDHVIVSKLMGQNFKASKFQKAFKVPKTLN